MLSNKFKDADFVFSDMLFMRIFAPISSKEIQRLEQVDLKFKFDLDMQRLNGSLKSLSPWITSHDGRLGIVILADAINYSMNFDTKDKYKFFDSAVGISYLMHNNRNLYFTYTLIERIQLAAPLVHLESI